MPAIALPYDGELSEEGLVATWVHAFKDILKRTRPILGDKSISLERRWSIYVEIQPFLETDSSYQDFKELGDVSWYDDFYLERGETQQLDQDFVTKCTSKFKMDKTRQDSLKEEILEYACKEGYGSFENDW